MAEDSTETAEKTEPKNLDADGLLVQEYRGWVLVVAPEKGFAEAPLRMVRSRLLGLNLGTRVVSTKSGEYLCGMGQDQFLSDGLIRDADVSEFQGLVFPGGVGAAALAGDPEVLRLAREAAAAQKPIAAWAEAVSILVEAGVVKGRTVAGPPALGAAVQRQGGRMSGRQVVVSGTLVTGVDHSVGLRLGMALAGLLKG